VNPGESAAAEAERARARASRFQRKASQAQFTADNFEKGAEGERMVAAALAPLERKGWVVLHDRRHPAGGNIDHIAIGPPGVAILDAKRWIDPITITPDRRLVASKHDHTDVVTKLNDLMDMVRSIFREDGARVAVRGCVVLAGDRDRSREVRDLGDVRILGVDGLGDELRRTRGDLDEAMVSALRDTLAITFPPVAAPLPPPPAPEGDTALATPSPLFEKAQNFYYLRPWRRAGHNRLYLRNSDGLTLGWTDVNTGARSVDCTGSEAKLAEALLTAADPTGMKLTASDLPKVATRLRGGRLLSKIALMHMSVLVGQEWRRYDKHRLYGTLIDPSATSWELGYVDLKTRTSHPSSEGNLSDTRGPAKRYLDYLLVKMPPDPPPKAKR